MTLDEIVRRVANEPIIDEAEVAAFCAAQAMTLAEFANAVSRSIAIHYYRGEWTYEYCDEAMNNLFGFFSLRVSKHVDFEMPPYAFDVFSAFDNGEYYHPEDRRDIDPEELYTKPAIAKILAEDEKKT